MRTNQLQQILCSAFLAIFFILAAMPSALACTRALYFGKEGQIVTGRTMDWVEDMQSNLWIFPRGMARGGEMSKKSLKWTSKYGSVVASGYEVGTADGMNEKGLVANLLYLAESEYPPEDKRPVLATSAVVQYILDNFATVEEAVTAIRQEKFRIVSVAAPNGRPGNVHFSISDASGDSAILEYIKGRQVIHHGRQYQVLTNSPTFDDQLALYEYWKQIGGTVMLPGTNRAADRFARASFYINATTQSADQREAVAAVFSVMRNVSVPLGISTPAQPNISSTIWRTVADQKNKIYFFESTLGPSVVWVRLNQIDFAPGSGVRRLILHGRPDLGGDQTANFQKAMPFKFLAPQ
jgi:choloylglycine hydrolase